MYGLTSAKCQEVASKASIALYEYCVKNGLHYLVTGSSGGLDSAVTLGLAERVCELARRDGYSLASVGVTLPCESSHDSVRLGTQAVITFGAHHLHIDLTPLFRLITRQVSLNAFGLAMDMEGVSRDSKVYDFFNMMVGADFLPGLNGKVQQIMSQCDDVEGLKRSDDYYKFAQGNLKARLRMICLYHIAKMFGSGFVLSTDNLSEYWMAFWTICGDVGDFGMIQNILKGLEMSDLAHFLGVPIEIIEAKPDDGLNIGNGDSDQLGAEYPDIDKIMIQLIQSGFDPDGNEKFLKKLPSVEGYSDELVSGISRRAFNGKFKRHGPFVLSREELGLPAVEDLEI
jgi:NAD+ synthetase